MQNALKLAPFGSVPVFRFSHCFILIRKEVAFSLCGINKNVAISLLETIQVSIREINRTPTKTANGQQVSRVLVPIQAAAS